MGAVSALAIMDEAVARLAAAGIDTPRNDAKLMLAQAYAVDAADVEKAVLLDAPLTAYANGQFDGEGPGQTAAYKRFEIMMQRRERREPLQYVVGHAPFRYLDLQVGPGVFIPRPETETVVQAAIDWLMAEGLKAPKLVDLCAGSGAIGLALATEVQGAEVWAVERSEKAAQWARRNEWNTLGLRNDERCGSERSVVLTRSTTGDMGGENGSIRSAETCSGVRASNDRSIYQLIQGDATDAATLAELDGTVDMVVTNPPYIPLERIPEQPEVRDHDPAAALYGGSADGLLIPQRIIERAENLLRPGGALVMEHDVSQGESLVVFASSHGFVGARTGNDLTGRPRYLFALKRSMEQ
jgi:release factor glutamine methyltransferase